FPGRQSSDRALRISVNDGWAATFELPMGRQTACNRALAAAAFHRRYCDDRARHIRLLAKCQSDESIESMLSFSWRIAYGPEPALDGY
ncbi:MAG TPA: hypothetical protein VK474_07005, partial [Chthoniobacterales bacterium]|nr:hypothetical protein [Chthoniobacterales bacterium]